MGLEIERKFLLVDETWRGAVERSTNLTQGYLVNDAVRSVRIRVSDDRAWLTVKSANGGLSRMEFEYAIPIDEATSILNTLCDGSVIRKTRFEVHHNGHLWEIDEFQGDNAGLVMAEIELRSEEEVFQRPSWAGEEVTGDRRYMNASLVENPWSSWGAVGSDPV